MTGLDTNVLVRYIAQDDEKQSPLATKLIESLTRAEPGFVSHVVLVEIVWVLESCYSADRDRIAEVVETLLRTDGIVVDRANVVWQALRTFKHQGCDFPDALIARLAKQAGCQSVATFDRNAARKTGMHLLA